MKCQCPGDREFEILNEPENELGQNWYVCACCGTRKLLPEPVVIEPEAVPETAPEIEPEASGTQ